MSLPGRHGSSDSYRYGFNGMEKDDEIKGEGNSYTTEFRQYDPRIVRWLSTDPVTHPHQSPYNAFDGNPILWADPSGADVDDWYEPKDGGKAEWFEGSDKQKGYKHLGAYLVEKSSDGSTAHITYQMEWSTTSTITNGSIDVLALPYGDDESSAIQGGNAFSKGVAGIQVGELSDLKGFSNELKRNNISISSFIASDHGGIDESGLSFFIGYTKFDQNNFKDLRFLKKNFKSGYISDFIIYSCGAIHPNYYDEYGSQLSKLAKKTGALTYAPMYFLPISYLYNDAVYPYHPLGSVMLSNKGVIELLENHYTQYTQKDYQPFIDYQGVWVGASRRSYLQLINFRIFSGQRPEFDPK